MTESEKEQFVKDNIKYVHKVAHKFQVGNKCPRFSHDDLVSVGRMALLKSLNSWRPGLKSTLRTYSYSAVNNEIRNYVSNNSFDLNYSSSMQKSDRKKGVESTKPIALRIDQCSINDDEWYTLRDSVLPSGSPPADHKTMVDEQTHLVKEALGCLTKRERFVINERFYEQKTLAAVGEGLGVTRQRVKQIQQRALNKLKNALSSNFDGVIYEGASVLYDSDSF